MSMATHQSITKFVQIIIINLVALKAAAKLELLLSKLASFQIDI
jgi:hypothetical protein